MAEQEGEREKDREKEVMSLGAKVLSDRLAAATMRWLAAFSLFWPFLRAVAKSTTGRCLCLGMRFCFSWISMRFSCNLRDLNLSKVVRRFFGGTVAVD